jgi:hypothetical protein
MRASCRRILAFIVTITAIAVVTVGIWKSGSMTPFAVANLKDLPANVLTMKAVEMRVDHIHSMFDLALISLGALWALILGSDEKRSLTNSSEWLMFSCASIVLIFAIVMYWSYTTNLEEALLMGGKANEYSTDISVPDVFQAAFEVQYYALLTFVWIGVASAGFTLFAAHRLK